MDYSTNWTRRQSGKLRRRCFNLDRAGRGRDQDEKPITYSLVEIGILNAITAGALAALLVFCVWAAGTVVWFIIQGWRIVLFARLAATARLASGEVQQQAKQLASSLGARRAPAVWILDATMSPILWSMGSRARVIFPADLLDRVRLIMSGVAPKSMSGTTRHAVLAAAAVFLPIGPELFDGAIRRADAALETLDLTSPAELALSTLLEEPNIATTRTVENVDNRVAVARQLLEGLEDDLIDVLTPEVAAWAMGPSSCGTSSTKRRFRAASRITESRSTAFGSLPMVACWRLPAAIGSLPTEERFYFGIFEAERRSNNSKLLPTNLCRRRKNDLASILCRIFDSAIFLLVS